ncbi:MAG: hypothetical protein N3C61_00005, partial [Candidatus Micrarchaeota archaeon]|nr:hypothetical protein [Candidatus Micrarchaeota archaeon]
MATVVLDHGSSGGMAKQDLDFGVRFDNYYIEMNHRSGSSDLFKVLAFGKAYVSEYLKQLDNSTLSLEQKMKLLQTELHKYGIKLDRGEASNWLVYFIAINERYGTSLSQIAANFIGYVNEDRNNLTRELRNLPLGVFGRLEHFVQNNELIKLANNISLQINKDSAGYYISINNQKHYITTKGSLIYKKNGKIIIEAIEDKSKLGERYEQLKKEGIGEIYYIYSGDLVSKKNGEITREKGIRVERLVSEPNGNVVYHGRILFQTTDVMVDNQHRRLEILFVRTDTGIRSYYRIVDPSQNYLD